MAIQVASLAHKEMADRVQKWGNQRHQIKQNITMKMRQTKYIEIQNNKDLLKTAINPSWKHATCSLKEHRARETNNTISNQKEYC